jgi:hypothetical protein
MAKGGRRPGAGRKPGDKNTRSREIADRAMQEGITPLEVMLQIMRKAWDIKDMDKALEAAKDAAPYVHPRLQPVDSMGSDTQKHELIISWMTEGEAKKRGWA